MGDEPLVEAALVSRIESVPGMRAERVIIGGTAERHLRTHDVIFDRMSRLVPHYRSYLRAVALSGTNVVNDPFAVADDKFFGLSMAARLGCDVPRTVLLPQKAYGPGVEPARNLGNLQFPLLWDELGHHVGFPARLLPARHTGVAPERVADVGGLLAAFDRTWDSPTMLQAEVAGASLHLRCICIGGERAVAVQTWPSSNGKRSADGAISRAAEASLRVSRALGLDFNVVDVVVTDSRVWVVDAVDPLAHLAPHTIGADPFENVMDRLAEHLCALARRHERTIAAHPMGRALSSR